MDSISQIKLKFKKVEKILKFDLNYFVYNNLNLFPLFKLLLHEGINRNIKPPLELNPNKNIATKIFNILKIPKLYFNKVFYLKKLKNKIKKSDIVFFSDQSFYYDQINGKKYNAFLDPYYEFIKNKKVLKLEIIPHYRKEKNNSKYIEPIYIKTIYINFKEFVVNKIKGSEIYLKNKHLTKMVNKINNHLNTNFDVIDFQNRIDQIIFESEGIEKILNIIKPKVVFLTCYYNKTSLSVILACKRLKIKTVDIQHGGYVGRHAMYDYWQNKLPKKGYEFLPDFFWIWQKEQLSDKIFFKKNSPHKAIVCGKMWIRKFNNNILKNRNNYISKSEKLFLNNLNKFKKKILFCATYEIPNCLLDAIKKTIDKNWLWLIRLHPRHGNIQQLNKKLEDLKIPQEKIEIHCPSKINLLILMQEVSHVVVDQSSVSFDAAYFNKPVICLNNNKDLFSVSSKLKVCKFTENSNVIINFIKKEKKNKCKFKIRSDLNTFNSALREVLD